MDKFNYYIQMNLKPASKTQPNYNKIILSKKKFKELIATKILYYLSQNYNTADDAILSAGHY